MRYGFAIDQRTCIGCHACTVACKTEHEIPVGQFRTWVKYVDKGEYPSTTREFGVMRCNHCTDTPCVAICPTTALFKRDDGIVDFDSDSCIGCKACMQACPYDAIYIDEDTHTAAKCNFCAHRVDEGLESRRPTVDHGRRFRGRLRHSGHDHAQHRTHSAVGWRVTTYLWTKSVGAGVLLVAGLALFLDVELGVLSDIVAPVLALVMTAITGALLVWDLKRPERFWYLFVRPQLRSWVVLGAYGLVAYGGLAFLWLVAGLTGADGALDVLRWLAVPALDLDTEARAFLARVLLTAIVVHLLMLAIEYGRKHTTRNASVAAHIIVRGRYARTFWSGCALAVVGAALSLAGWGGGASLAVVLAGLLAQPALLAYESVFVRAAQDVPLS